MFICKNCGKEFTEKYSKWSDGRFCCKECARSYSTKEKRKEINKKVSKKLKETKKYENSLTKSLQTRQQKIYKNKEQYYINPNYCQICNKELTYKQRKNKTCSYQCRNKLISLHTEPLTHHTHRGYYKNIWCDSSWELAFLVYCLDNNIPIKRNKNAYVYQYNNTEHLYYPDFIINNTLIEIKGYETEKWKYKLKNCSLDKELIVINKIKIKKYLDYVKQKYGKYFYNLLYDGTVA